MGMGGTEDQVVICPKCGKRVWNYCSDPKCTGYNGSV